LTTDNFTPRPETDMLGKSGQKPGLSASANVPPGKKAQGIETELLRLPLKAFPDDPDHGGSPDHFAIAPVDENGEVDVSGLVDWASYRRSGNTHRLTQLLLDAVVQPNVRGDQ
jgi:hypothetical protein